METPVHFFFRGSQHTADAYLSFEEEPYYVFVFLHSRELIEEFGKDITIKTDGLHSLSRRDSYPRLDELRTTIFEAAKATPAFQQLLAAGTFRWQPISATCSP